MYICAILLIFINSRTSVFIFKLKYFTVELYLTCDSNTLSSPCPSARLTHSTGYTIADQNVAPTSPSSNRYLQARYNSRLTDCEARISGNTRGTLCVRLRIDSYYRGL